MEIGLVFKLSHSQYTNRGDLRKYLYGYFESTGGNRKKAHSDIDISKSLGVDKPSEVLFVTDIYEEAVAAKNAGLSLSSLEMHLFQNIMGSNSAFIHGDLMIESGLVVQTPTWINGLSILILFCSYVGLWIRCVVYLFFCNHYS